VGRGLTVIAFGNHAMLYKQFINIRAIKVCGNLADG